MDGLTTAVSNVSRRRYHQGRLRSTVCRYPERSEMAFSLCLESCSPHECLIRGEPRISEDGFSVQQKEAIRIFSTLLKDLEGYNDHEYYPGAFCTFQSDH